MARTVDQRIIDAALPNLGAVTTAALAAAGVSRTSVRTRVNDGFLEEIAKGVFIVPSLGRALATLAAVQLAIPTSAISHQTAARLLKMGVPRNGIHLTCPKSHTRRIDGVQIHETRRLDADDVMLHKGLRITTPSRTLWDLVNVLPPASHRELVSKQLAQKRPTEGELIACHEALARRGRTGTVRMRELMFDLLDDEPFPESELERLVLLELVKRGAPKMYRQFMPPWYDGIRGIVDFADPLGKTIIEADGRRWHASERATGSDLERDLIAAKHGWHVIRIGWHEVVYRPGTILTAVIEILEARQAIALGA